MVAQRSIRPMSLTEQQAIDLRAWYYGPRTVAEKAKELGVTPRTIYRYINRVHKQRRESIDELMSQLRDVPRETQPEERHP